MRKIQNLLVEGIRFGCEIDRAFDKLLTASGSHRKFYSTKGQDRWVIKRALDAHRGGYFVDIGAADGRTHSNTYVLERDYGWSGVAIEANPRYFSELRHNRACRCVQSCVDGYAQEVDFFGLGYMGGMISDDTDNGRQKRTALIKRHADKIISMRTSTLRDILVTVGAPTVIDYLSIDVEGAEHRILETFPFNEFRFHSLTVERPRRETHEVLRHFGYVLDRFYRFDGFYVSQARASILGITECSFSGAKAKSF